MLTKQEKSLTKVSCIYFFSGALANIFLQFYVFKYINFAGLVYYNVVLLAFLVLAYIASGYLLRQFSTKLLIQISIFLTIFFYILLYIFKESALSYVAFLGMLSGISAGLYWSGYNLSQYILTHMHSRDHFFSKYMSIFNSTSAIGPLLGGLIVSFAGYSTLFGVVGLLNIYLLFVAHDLPVHTGVQFKVSQFRTYIRSKNWRKVLWLNFVLGLFDTGFSVISGIIFFLVLTDPGVVGFVRSGIFLLSTGASMYAGILLKKYHHINIYAGILTTIGILIFALYQSPMGIILYGVITGLAWPIITVQFSSIILNTMDETPEHWSQKYHMFIERDTVLGVARVASMGIMLLLFGFYSEHSIATGWILITSIVPLLLGLLLQTKNTTH